MGSGAQGMLRLAVSRSVAEEFTGKNSCIQRTISGALFPNGTNGANCCETGQKEQIVAKRDNSDGLSGFPFQSGRQPVLPCACRIRSASLLRPMAAASASLCMSDSLCLSASADGGRQCFPVHVGFAPFSPLKIGRVGCQNEPGCDTMHHYGKHIGSRFVLSGNREAKDRSA